MGAAEFRNTGRGKTVGEAFSSVRDEALYMHGHGGYSGTIAEKGDFVLFPIPEGMTAATFIAAVERVDFPLPGPVATPLTPEQARIVKRAYEVWNDKWGAACAIEVPPEKDGIKTFCFFGLASE